MATSIRAFGRATFALPLSKRAMVPSMRLFSASAQPETPSGGSQAPSGGPQMPQIPNPFSAFEQFGRDSLQKAQEVAQTAAQSIGDATNNTTGAAGLQNLQNIPGNLMSGAGPILQNIQGVAQANANTLTQQCAPLMTALLILARSSPGQPLTDEQKAKIAQVFPSDAQEMFHNLNEVVPEDPHLVQLRRIADSLAVIEAHLTKTAAAEPAAAEPAAAEPAAAEPAAAEPAAESAAAAAPAADSKSGSSQ